MTEPERTVMAHLVDAWNSFLQLPTEHADDVDEFRHGIHALQKQIMARPTRRELNRPLSIQERTDAAVKAERERSERLSKESPRKAAEAVPERAANQSLANGPCDAATERPAQSATTPADKGEATGYAESFPTNSPETAEHATVIDNEDDDGNRLTVTVDPRIAVILSKPEPIQHRETKPLRPFCQKPGREDCGGYGTRHCRACEAQRLESEAAA